MEIIDLNHEKRMLNAEIRSSEALSHSYKSLSESVLGEYKRLANIKAWFYEQLKEIAEKTLAMIDDPERFDIEDNSYLIKKFLKTIEKTNKTLSDCVKSMEPDESDRCRVATNAMMDFTSLYAKLLVNFGTEITWLEDGLE